MNQTSQSLIFQIVHEATQRECKSIDRITAGEINEVYNVTLDDNEHVIVRISRRVGSQELQREEWAIKQCAHLGLPVPELLLTKDIHEFDEPLAFSVHKRIEGESLSSILKENIDPAVLKKIMHHLGETLDRIHTIKTDGFGILNANGKGEYTTFTEYFREITDNDSYYLSLAEKVGIETHIMQKALALLTQAQNYQIQTACLTHADLSASNIIVNNDQVTGIIDWGLASGGHPIFDIAHWDYILPGDEYSETTESLANGPLSDEDTSLMNLYKIRLALVRINWYASQNNALSVTEHKHKLTSLVNG